jgi:carboxypeptidase Q
MRADGLENVHTEPVMVPRWVRGEESAELVAPRAVPLHMLGLGGSVGTPPEGIEAEVLVVGSFDELQARAAEARGRIVLWDVPFTDYGQTVQYRSRGVVEAARAGAVASLIRSVGPFGMQTPHTGSLRYADTVARIPGAALSMEDAMMLRRMVMRGDHPRVRLRMGAQMLPDAPSRNVVAELRGRERPDEVVVLGGHIDSWDVAPGAMDDAGGCIAAWEAVRLMARLGLRPRRTVRVVLWTNEENGTRGGNAYRDAHRSEVERHVLAIESDEGVFAPTGFGFTGTDAAYETVRGIGALLAPIGAGTVNRGGGGADIGPIMALGVRAHHGAGRAGDGAGGGGLALLLVPPHGGRHPRQAGPARRGPLRGRHGRDGLRGRGAARAHPVRHGAGGELRHPERKLRSRAVSDAVRTRQLLLNTAGR